MTTTGRQATRQRFDAPLAELMREAAASRNSAHGRLISYSRKVFIPLTKLCRDVCHYCTFAQVPRAGKPVYPAGREYKLAGSDEKMSTFDGTFEIVVPLHATDEARPGAKPLKMLGLAGGVSAYGVQATRDLLI